MNDAAAWPPCPSLSLCSLAQGFDTQTGLVAPSKYAHISLLKLLAAQAIDQVLWDAANCQSEQHGAPVVRLHLQLQLAGIGHPFCTCAASA